MVIMSWCPSETCLECAAYNSQMTSVTWLLMPCIILHSKDGLQEDISRLSKRQETRAHFANFAPSFTSVSWQLCSIVMQRVALQVWCFARSEFAGWRVLFCVRALDCVQIGSTTIQHGPHPWFLQLCVSWCEPPYVLVLCRRRCMLNLSKIPRKHWWLSPAADTEGLSFPNCGHEKFLTVSADTTLSRCRVIHDDWFHCAPCWVWTRGILISLRPHWALGVAEGGQPSSESGWEK